HVPPPTGSSILVPAGTPGRVRWSGGFDWLHIYLEPGLVARVAAEAFGLDPARLTGPPLHGLDLPHLRAAMGAVDAELSTRGGGGGGRGGGGRATARAPHRAGPLAPPRGRERGRAGTWPGGGLRAVVEYIEEPLDATPTRKQRAGAARLTPSPSARQFKAAT